MNVCLLFHVVSTLQTFLDTTAVISIASVMLTLVAYILQVGGTLLDFNIVEECVSYNKAECMLTLISVLLLAI